jgi:hypothetical protein
MKTIEEIAEEEMRMVAAHSDAFEFWEDPREDLYQDYIEK